MKAKIKFANMIYDILGDGDRGNPSPPGSNQSLDFGEKGRDPASRPMYVASTWVNDGFEIGIGYPSEWHAMYRDKDARKLAWFILWDWWAVATWFGLKRKIWYSALYYIVKQRRNSQPHDKQGVSA